MAPFVGDALSEDELRDLCAEAYGRFDHAGVTPLVQLDHRHWLLEMFHGTTLAFKDVALQMIGLLIERLLSRIDMNVTIIRPTSGDNRSAEIGDVGGVGKVEIVHVQPAGRRTPLRELT